MRIVVDKVMIECINKEFCLDLTYATFKKFYIEVVKLQRDISPSVQKKRALNSNINDLLSGEHERLYAPERLIERLDERIKLFEKYKSEAEAFSKLNKD